MTQNRPILASSSLATLPSFQVEEFCPPRLRDGQGRLHHTGIELLAGLLPQYGLRLRKRTGRPVRPIMGHGIQCIHDREDASDDRDILTLETLRIAASVMVLLMATNYVAPPRENPAHPHHPHPAAPLTLNPHPP